MSEITTNISVVYTEEPNGKLHRYLDGAVIHNDTSHNKGKANLSGGVKDYELATKVNYITIMLDNASKGKSFDIRVGDTTANQMKNMKMFVYDGETTTIFVDNPGTDPVILRTVEAKY